MTINLFKNKKNCKIKHLDTITLIYMDSLPIDIFNIINKYTNINKLLNTTKKLDDVKHKIFVWKLTITTTAKYYKKCNFSERVNKKMFNPRKQLTLNFACCDDIKIAPNRLDNISTLNLYYSKYIKNIYELKNIGVINLFCDYNYAIYTNFFYGPPKIEKNDYILKKSFDNINYYKNKYERKQPISLAKMLYEKEKTIFDITFDIVCNKDVIIQDLLRENLN
jgi:hypothetical protein